MCLHNKIGKTNPCTNVGMEVEKLALVLSLHFYSFLAIFLLVLSMVFCELFSLCVAFFPSFFVCFL